MGKTVDFYKQLSSQRKEIEGIILELDDIESINSEAFDQYPHLISFCNVEEFYCMVNHAYEKFFGIKKDAIVGKPIKEIIGKKTYKMAKKHIKKVLSGVHVHYREFFSYRNGIKAIFDGVLIPFTDQSGKVSGYFAILTDITEFLAVQIKSLSAHNRYEAILQQASDEIWLADLDLQLTYVNDPTQGLFGYTPEERSNLDLNDIFFPETAGRMKQLFEEKLQEVFRTNKKLKEPVNIEIELPKKDGTKIWVEIKADFIYEENNLPIGIIGVTRNIDKRKKAEISQMSSENLFRTIWDIGLDGMAISDKHGIIKNVNQQFCKIYGYTFEELSGAEFSIIFPAQHRKEALKEYMNVFKHGEPGTSHKAAIIRKDGSSRSVVSRIEFIYKDGERDLMLSVVRDVTKEEIIIQEKEEAIRNYELLAKYSSDSIVILENENVTYMSPALPRLLGYTEEELNSVNLKANVHPDDRERVVGEFTKDFKQGNLKHHTFEYRQKHKNGHYIWLQSTIMDILTQRDKHVIIINSKNIQEEYEVREQLIKKEALYTTLFEQMSSGVAIYEAANDGEDFIFVDFNPAAEKITAAKRDSVIGCTVSEIFPNMPGTKLFKSLQEVHESGKPMKLAPFYYEDEYRKGWRENFIFKLPTGETVAIFDDISERILHEQKAREREYLLKEAQRIANIGYFVFNVKNGTWEASETFDSIFGINEDFERTIEEWLNLIHPDQKKEIATYMYDYVIKQQTKFDKTYSIINQKTGEVRNIHGIAEPFFDDDGVLVQMIGTIQDITEQIQYQKVLEDSRARFLEIFEGVGEGILYLSNEGKILEVNENLLKMAGLTMKEVKGVSFEEIIANFVKRELLSADIFSVVQEGLTGKSIHDKEISFGNRILQASSVATYDKSGIVAVFRDITNEKKNELALLQHKERLESLLKMSQQKSGSLQRILYNSLDEAVKLTGAISGYLFLYSPDRNIFTHFSSCLNGKVKYLKNRKEYTIEDFKLTQADHEIKLPKIYNEKIPVKNLPDIIKENNHLSNLLFLPLIIDEELKAIIILINKKTDFSNDDILQINLLMDTIWKIIEKQEHQFQLLRAKEKAEESESFSSAIAKISRKLIQQDLSIPGIASLVYEAALDLTKSSYGFVSLIDPKTGVNTGYHLGEQEIDQQFSLVPDTNGYSGMWGHALNSGESFYTNTPASHPAYREENEGSIALENFLAVPALVEEKVVGEIVLANKTGGFNHKDVAIVEELSNIYAIAIHRKHTEEELIRAKEKAIESDHLKSSFLANMSHEIRTPMNGIVGFTEFLARDNVSPEKRKYYADIVVQSSHQLLSIVNDILDISKIETGQFSLSPSVFNVNNLVMSVFTIYEKRAKEQGISLYPVKALSGSLANIETDQTKLTQILNNLLNNAFKFTNQGQISFGYTLKEKEKLTFFVEDTGIGIEKEFHSKIFQRFTQAENTLSRNYGGTGLGLAITRSLVELMGGEIWFDTDIGKGTTFYFTLPYSQKLQEINNDSNAETENKMEKNKNFTVLVAEDEEINYIYIEELLSDLNLDFLHARNGKEAVDMFQSRSDIGLVLMDIKMPVMNGYDATRAIKSLKPDMPVYAQTAYAMSEDRERAMLAGCDGHLAKPLNQKELMNIILSVKNNRIEPSS